MYRQIVKHNKNNYNYNNINFFAIQGPFSELQLKIEGQGRTDIVVLSRDYSELLSGKKEDYEENALLT